MKTYLFKVELKREEDGRWSVSIPTLKGCTSWGHSREEALKNIQDAAEAYLEDMKDTGEGITFREGEVEVIDTPAVAVTV